MNGSDLEIVRVSMDAVHTVSAVRVYMPEDLREIDQRIQVFRAIQDAKDQFPEEELGLPVLDPIDDMNIDRHCDAKELETITDRLTSLKQRLGENSVSKMNAGFFFFLIRHFKYSLFEEKNSRLAKSNFTKYIFFTKLFLQNIVLHENILIDRVLCVCVCVCVCMFF